MTSRMKRRLLVTAVTVFASVSLASAQGLSGGAASEKGTSAGQAGGGISQSATGGSRGEGMRQGHKATHFISGGSIAAVDLSPGDIRVVQRVLIERGLLHGRADGILGPKTRNAISAFQRQQGIQVTGSIDARTVSSLGVSDRLSRQAKQSIGQSQSSPTGAQTSTTGEGQAGAAVDLSRDDIRVVQRVLIERGLLHGKADGILGPKTRNAVSAFQRQQDIQVTGSIDARTVSSLGVSGRLSRQANQSIGQSQSSPTGAQTSTTGQEQAGAEQVPSGQPQPRHQNATGQAPDQTTGQAASSPAQQNQPSSTTGQGQAGTEQAPTSQPQPNQQNATGQAPERTTGQTASSPAQQNQPSTTTGRSMVPNQSNTTRQAAPRPQSEIKPAATEYAPSDTISLTFTDAAIGFILLALGAFIIMPAV